MMIIEQMCEGISHPECRQYAEGDVIYDLLISWKLLNRSKCDITWKFRPTLAQNIFDCVRCVSRILFPHLFFTILSDLNFKKQKKFSMFYSLWERRQETTVTAEAHEQIRFEFYCIFVPTHSASNLFPFSAFSWIMQIRSNGTQLFYI